MTSPLPNDDGSLDGLGAFRKAFGDEETGAQAPAHPEHKHWKAITLLAIDEFTEPAIWCPNGHITAWVVERGKPDEAWVSLVARYPREVLLMDHDDRDPNFKPTTLCIVCGEEGVINGEATQDSQ